MSKNNISAFTAATGTSSNGSPDFQERFIRRPDVIEITSLPSSSLTDLINKGEFPAPFKLSERSSAWKLSEVMDWFNTRQRAA